ncbi:MULTISPECIES: head decoration protein [Methylococcus]|uniref:Bacteriophage lambda head decoration protein D n=1 Tax=Methylococcus capsulatus (strain ATCC 33009 / NCIMB 11132 / Bath) TaxID=243233 RepID=Q602Y4_METCA|nr:head decoration protein [Methylococcus capsulatus]AAU90988.1 conserved hypothetical protein [Methylococcus capsulatus str. Bath]
MPSHTDPKVISDVLLYEVGEQWSRDRVTIAAGADLALGSVLGRISASGKYKLHDPAAADGSQNAVAVLLANAAAAGADVAAPVIARGAVLDANGLVWKSGITDPQKATARAALLALGLKVIDSV